MDEAKQRDWNNWPPRLTEDELAAFVRGVVERRIFVSDYCRSVDDVAMVFMPIGLGALAGTPKEAALRVGCLWEYMDEAGPRSINGYPCFFSVRFMHADDWERARPSIVAEQERLKNLKVP